MADRSDNRAVINYFKKQNRAQLVKPLPSQAVAPEANLTRPELLVDDSRIDTGRDIA